MLNKHIILGVVSAISMLSYISPTQAYNSGYYGSSSAGVNGQAWHAFTRAKQQKYDLEHTLERAPFPKTSSDKNLVKVDLGKRAWGAYDSNGNLIKWGSASGGQAYCADIGKSCKTVTGTFTFYSKKGPNHKSNQFPVPKGGAPMPYCMHFQGGYALHGGNVPDFNASHGCIRVPVREAQWLNQNFVDVGKTRISISYN